MRLKVGQWAAVESMSRDRVIVGKIVEASPDHVVMETSDRCSPGETRRITFDGESPWLPTQIRWKRVCGRRAWEYAR